MSSPISPISALHDHLNSLNLWYKTIELKRGDHIHLAGETDGDIYYVANGTLRSYVIVDDEEQIIRFGYQGDFVAAIDSYITGQPTMLSTQALRKTTLQIIRRTDFHDALDRDPILSKTWQKIMPWMIIGQLEREVDLLTNDPAERYRRVLNRSPRLFQEVPAKYIANYLRMTPETMSRIKKTVDGSVVDGSL
jgi:CRP-like cAMP-binding protein